MEFECEENEDANAQETIRKEIRTFYEDEKMTSQLDLLGQVLLMCQGIESRTEFLQIVKSNLAALFKTYLPDLYELQTEQQKEESQGISIQNLGQADAQRLKSKVIALFHTQGEIS